MLVLFLCLNIHFYGFFILVLVTICIILILYLLVETWICHILIRVCLIPVCYEIKLYAAKLFNFFNFNHPKAVI